MENDHSIPIPAFESQQTVSQSLVPKPICIHRIIPFRLAAGKRNTNHDGTRLPDRPVGCPYAAAIDPIEKLPIGALEKTNGEKEVPARRFGSKVPPRSNQPIRPSWRTPKQPISQRDTSGTCRSCIPCRRPRAPSWPDLPAGSGYRPAASAASDRNW